MKEKEHLAIASIPIQKMQNVYEDEKALLFGTIFPELNLPFYHAEDFAASERKDATPQDQMMRQIQEISFVLDDIRLYMDTHPEDEAGLQLLKEYTKRRKVLLKEFALQFYPLTFDCLADIYEEKPDTNCYCWQEGPIPWEGVYV